MSERPGEVVTEDHFTHPRPDLPHPEWWHATDGESAEVEVSALVGALVRAAQPEFVVETGTAWGQTAEAIGRALDTNGHGHLVSLEIDPECVAYSRQRCAGLPVEVLHRSSLEYTPDEPVDMCWLDSALDLRVVEAHAFKPWLRVGALIGVHDAGPLHGIRPSLDRLVSEGWLHAMFIGTARGVFLAEVLSTREA